MVMRLGEIGGGQHRHHARRILGGRNVDVLDIGEGVRRAHEASRQRTLRFDVVAETPGAAQQRVVFDAPGPGLGFGWRSIPLTVLRRREI